MSIFKRIKSFFGGLFKKKGKSEDKDKIGGDGMAYGIQVGGNQVTRGQLDPNGYGMSINNRKVDIDSAIKITHSRWVGNEDFNPSKEIFIRGSDLKRGNGWIANDPNKVNIVNSTVFYTRSNIPSGSYGIKVNNSSMLSSDLLLARKVELRNLSSNELYDIYVNYSVPNNYKDKFFSLDEVYLTAAMRGVLIAFALLHMSGGSDIPESQFKQSLEKAGLLSGTLTYYELY